MRQIVRIYRGMISAYYSRRNRIINEGNANHAGHVVVLILRTSWVDPRDTRSAGGIALKASFGSARSAFFERASRLELPPKAYN